MAALVESIATAWAASSNTGAATGIEGLTDCDLAVAAILAAVLLVRSSMAAAV